MCKRDRQRRGVLGGLVAVALCALSLSRAVGSPEANLEPAAARLQVVRPGDTLWALAKLTESPRTDRRELVWLLQQVNGLSSATLRPGQVLLVPSGPEAVKRALRDPRGFAALTRIRPSSTVSSSDILL